MSLEIYLKLHEARTVSSEVRGSSHGLGREEVLGAATMAAHKFPYGHTLFLAENGDEKSLLKLKVLAQKELPGYEEDLVLAVTGRPIKAQLDQLIRQHPNYDRERRRASEIKAKAKHLARSGNQDKADDLYAQADEVILKAIERCKREILSTGKCPKCHGTGKMERKHDDCPVCRGLGKIFPDTSFFSVISEVTHKKFNELYDMLMIQKSEWIRCYFDYLSQEKAA